LGNKKDTLKHKFPAFPAFQNDRPPPYRRVGNPAHAMNITVNLPTLKPNIEAYAPQNSESGSYVVVCRRHTVNLKQTKLKTNKHLGVSLCQ